MRTTSNPSTRHLQAAALSLRVFGLYLCATGLGLLLMPAVVLTPLQLPVPPDVWIRLVGVLALALGLTDLVAARAALPMLLRASVWRRALAGAAMGTLVVAALAPPAVLLFAAVDLAAAGWTAWALRRLPAGTPGPGGAVPATPTAAQPAARGGLGRDQALLSQASASFTQ